MHVATESAVNQTSVEQVLSLTSQTDFEFAKEIVEWRVRDRTRQQVLRRFRVNVVLLERSQRHR